MGKRRLRQGDEVVVIAGNDKGSIGKVLRFTKERVVVEGVNVRKKHMKKTQENQQGQILDIEMPIHISNVKPSIEGKAVVLRAAFNKEGEKELVYRDGKKQVKYRTSRKPKS